MALPQASVSVQDWFGEHLEGRWSDVQRPGLDTALLREALEATTDSECSLRLQCATVSPFPDQHHCVPPGPAPGGGYCSTSLHPYPAKRCANCQANGAGSVKTEEADGVC